MKTPLLIIALFLSLLAKAQISLPYYEDFDDVEAQGWTVASNSVWFLDSLQEDNWVLYSSIGSNVNAYYHLFSPTFYTGNAVSPRFRCDAKFNRMDNSWNCAPKLSVVVENLDNSQEVTYEYGSNDDVCSGEDASISPNTLFTVSRPLPLNANVRIRVIANFFDPGWLYIDNVEVRDVNASGVEKVLPLTALNVFPSPIQDIATISFNLVHPQKFSIEIFNELGQVVWYEDISSNPGSHKQEVDVTALSSGIYYIRLSNESFNVSRKLVKQ